MARNASEKQRDDKAGHDERLGDLFKLIDSIETGLLTTRRPDGRLVSRPMSTQLRTEEGHLWFVTDRDTHKVDELEADPNVNVAYYNNRTREWVSISGRARATREQSMIDALYAPDWKMWFGEGGGKNAGTPKDPRIVLVEVIPESATYLKSDRPAVVALFSIAKGLVTGKAPKFGDLREVDGAEIAQGRASSGKGQKSTSRSSKKTAKRSGQKTASSARRSRAKAKAGK